MSRTNKGTTLSYLGLHPDYSCGLGDSPEGNDKPLREYWTLVDGQNRLMPFVSVAEAPPENLPNQYHIGNRVLGAKAFFETLNEVQQEGVSFQEAVRKAGQKR